MDRNFNICRFQSELLSYHLPEYCTSLIPTLWVSNNNHINTIISYLMSRPPNCLTPVRVNPLCFRAGGKIWDCFQRGGDFNRWPVSEATWPGACCRSVDFVSLVAMIPDLTTDRGLCLAWSNGQYLSLHFMTMAVKYCFLKDQTKFQIMQDHPFSFSYRISNTRICRLS